MDTKEQYVLAHYGHAQKAGARYNMNPVAILAQGALESAWGQSHGAKVRRNHFGITAAGGPNEFWDGSYTVGNNQYALKFRVYRTAQDSFYDFARLISSRYRQSHALSRNIEAYAASIAGSPYISESNGDNRDRYRLNIIYAARRIDEILKKKGMK